MGLSAFEIAGTDGFSRRIEIPAIETLEPTVFVVGVIQIAIQPQEPTVLVVGAMQLAIATIEPTALVVGVIKLAFATLGR